MKANTSTLGFTGKILLIGGLAAGIASHAFGDATPTGDQYLLTDLYGGSWYDTEKTSDNTEDDLMCWAAATANVLQWTGWGAVSGASSADELFGYYQDHWSDAGGNSYYGLDWWLSGNNGTQGIEGWSQVDVAGGGFYPELDINDFRRYEGDDASVMSAIDSMVNDGLGITLAVASDTVGHMITAWGYNVNPDDASDYLGVWVTDSDDDKGGEAPRSDQLRYYEVAESGGQWFLQDYYGYNDIYISEVVGMEQIPEPAAVLLIALAGGGIFAVRRIFMI